MKLHSKSNTLYTSLNKLSLTNINKFQVLQTVYKSIYLPCTLPTSFNTLFKLASQVHSINTRSGEGNCLFHVHARLIIRKASIKIQDPSLWNGLPVFLRDINSL